MKTIFSLFLSLAGLTSLAQIGYSAQLYYSVIPYGCGITMMDLQVQGIYPDGIDIITIHYHSMDGLHDDFSQDLLDFSAYSFELDYPGYFSFEIENVNLGTVIEVIVLNAFEPIIETVGNTAYCLNCATDGPIYWKYTTFNDPDNWQEFWNTSDPTEFTMSENVLNYQVCVSDFFGDCTVCSNPISTSVSNHSRKEDFLIFDNGSEQPTIRLSHPGKIEIFSMEGKLVEVIQGKEILPNLAKGLYVVKSGTYTKKLVIG